MSPGPAALGLLETAGGTMADVIGRLHLDCPDPSALAEFYSELLGQPVTYRREDWVVVSRDSRTSGLAFQLSPDYRPPTWPDPEVEQQLHLDVMVDDVSAADKAVRALGARKLDRPNVYADPQDIPSASCPDRPGLRRCPTGPRVALG